MHDTNLSFLSLLKGIYLHFIKGIFLPLFCFYLDSQRTFNDCKNSFTFCMVKKEQEPEIYEQCDEPMNTHMPAQIHIMNPQTTLQILLISEW